MHDKIISLPDLIKANVPSAKISTRDDGVVVIDLSSAEAFAELMGRKETVYAGHQGDTP